MKGNHAYKYSILKMLYRNSLPPRKGDHRNSATTDDSWISTEILEWRNSTGHLTYHAVLQDDLGRPRRVREAVSVSVFLFWNSVNRQELSSWRSLRLGVTNNWVVLVTALNEWSRENRRNMDNQIHDLIHEPTLQPCINRHKNCISLQDRKPKTRHYIYVVQFPWQFLQEEFGNPLRSSDDIFVMALANLAVP